jgi:hypothetical protein
MPKLHLVGITPDHRGLVLSEHARAKHGDMVLEIDDRLLEAINKAHRLRTQQEGHRLESAALPSRREAGNGEGATPRLTPREIQQRLRAGESVAALARSSGTDEAWIRRFAAPVLAEQAKVVELARSLTFTKRGVGPSGAALGPAVASNVIDRGGPFTLPELEAGWGAYQHPEGGWHVTFTFPLRGRRQRAEWELDLASGELTARNKLASELAWRETGRKAPPAKAAKPPAPRRGLVQALPLQPAASPPSDAGPAPKAPRRATSAKAQASAPPAPAAKRTAAAATEAPAQSSVVPVATPAAAPGDEPAGSRTPQAKAPENPVPEGDRPNAGNPETPAAESPAPQRPPGSMPPTDLDVVDVTGEFPPFDEHGADDEILLVDEPTTAEGAPARPESPAARPTA